MLSFVVCFLKAAVKLCMMHNVWKVRTVQTPEIIEKKAKIKLRLISDGCSHHPWCSQPDTDLWWLVSPPPDSCMYDCVQASKSIPIATNINITTYINRQVSACNKDKGGLEWVWLTNTISNLQTYLRHILCSPTLSCDIYLHLTIENTWWVFN